LGISDLGNVKVGKNVLGKTDWDKVKGTRCNCFGTKVANQLSLQPA